MKDFQPENEAFVARLVEICRDSGYRAALRRWWSPTTRHHALPILGGKLFALNEKLLVTPEIILSALYATHANDSFQAHRSGGNSIGQSALELGGKKMSSGKFPSMERHFRRLLACDSLNDLAMQLNRLIKRLERERIPLDYVLLLKHLSFWSKPSRPELRDVVKTRWSLHFWQAPSDLPTP